MPEQEATNRRHAEASDPATSAQRLEVLSIDPQIRPIVAGNPSADPQLLEWLATDQDEQVRAQVASNPSTPWATLEHLGTEFPHAFLHHPARPQYLLTDPEQISTDERFWGGLLREASVPSWWWNWLLSHPTLSVSATVRLHIQYAGETTHPYGVRQEGEERLLLALVEVLSVVCTPLADRRAANQAGATYEPIVKEHLQWLAHSSDPQVRQGVALDWQTPVEVLQTLALDADDMVRASVASNEHTPVEVLQTLALDTNEEVRAFVASNEHTPPEILQTLARDADAKVRRLVASNWQASDEILQTLARDADAQVQHNVTSNAQAPAEILQTLDWDAESERSARWLANLTLRLSVESEKHIERERWWEDLATFSPATLSSVEDQLNRIECIEAPDAVRQIILVACAADWDASWVRDAFAQVTSPEGDERIFAFMQFLVPFMPAIALAKLAASPIWQIRYLIALHEQTPWETRQRLCQDGNRYVRALARATTAQITTPATD